MESDYADRRFPHLENLPLDSADTQSRIYVDRTCVSIVDSYDDSKRYHRGFHSTRSFAIIVPSRLSYWIGLELGIRSVSMTS